MTKWQLLTTLLFSHLQKFTEILPAALLPKSIVSVFFEFRDVDVYAVLSNFLLLKYCQCFGFVGWWVVVDLTHYWILLGSGNVYIM